MTYSVKEIFYTLQGDSVQMLDDRRSSVGSPDGNLWSGREEDRATAQCSFADTDFVGTDGTSGGKFKDARDLANTIANHWPVADHAHRFVVLTGGEPLLQVDSALTTALAEEGFFIAVETNGTVSPPDGLDWICVSPTAGDKIRVRAGNELKLVFPQIAFDPKGFEQLAFDRLFYLQPMDGPDQARNIAKQSIIARLIPGGH